LERSTQLARSQYLSLMAAIGQIVVLTLL